MAREHVHAILGKPRMYELHAPAVEMRTSLGETSAVHHTEGYYPPVPLSIADTSPGYLSGILIYYRSDWRVAHTEMDHRYRE